MRIAQLLLVSGMVSTQALPQRPSPLDSLPFDEWLKGKDNARFDWSLTASHATLSESQRLVASIFAEIKGDEIRKRPGSGQLVMMMQIRDPENHTYRSRPARFGSEAVRLPAAAWAGANECSWCRAITISPLLFTTRSRRSTA